MRSTHRKWQLTFITVLGIMGAALPTRVVAAPTSCVDFCVPGGGCPTDLVAFCSDRGCQANGAVCYQGNSCDGGSHVWCEPFK